MLNQSQLQEIARKQAQLKTRSAKVLAVAGTTLVTIACYGMLFTNDVDYAIVLVFGFLIAMFGFVSLKQ